jgi:hypothetical protein
VFSCSYLSLGDHSFRYSSWIHKLTTKVCLTKSVTSWWTVGLLSGCRWKCVLLLTVANRCISLWSNWQWCLPMYQSVLNFVPVATDMLFGGKPGTGANRYTSCCFGTTSVSHRLCSRGYNTPIILFGQLPMEFWGNEIWDFTRRLLDNIEINLKNTECEGLISLRIGSLRGACEHGSSLQVGLHKIRGVSGPVQRINV